MPPKRKSSNSSAQPAKKARKTKPPKVKAIAYKSPSAPYFPNDYEIIQNAVLQYTDFKNNNNKYYALELHTAEEDDQEYFRLFSHYGRTGDLENNPEAGKKEVRHYDSLEDAKAGYDQIFNQKTAPSKGYKQINLASSNIGSDKARGMAAGEISDRTREKMEQNQKRESENDSKDNEGNNDEEEKEESKSKPKIESELNPKIQELVSYIYQEATQKLTTTVSARITNRGIETPLGILSVEQVEKGEEILMKIHELLTNNGSMSRIEDLSANFFTQIPHRLGRSRAAIRDAVINDLSKFKAKQELCQLMKDMINVNNGDSASQDKNQQNGNVLLSEDVDTKYDALGCSLEHVDPSSDEYKFVQDEIKKSEKRSHGSETVNIANVFRVSREEEEEWWKDIVEEVPQDNNLMLYHGSRISNWVGLLSRGILMPKVVVSMGVRRTDPGWLGHGIYFGDADTGARYATSGDKGTAFLLMCNVCLGNMKDYHKITYGLSKPPEGYHSCHGVMGTEFDDHEYVIYDRRQHKISYMVEIKGNSFTYV
eukprot:gb/GECH01015012.1/.p1 GENE.gb/GECH01015012.1/~~gb/GECH01015012.1/.p1  ORF type:complete len:539 (+),score=167.92 gb/GECH01015012.1/:1-1617(+)